ncbi:beta strand repeat-containing protein [Polynucleobacter sp. HIN9]|uniref:beta strand repeat-containing protein n=1 Tax=Polynucleobacter sp. HIN9 TaxID=3047868 RepID=UPI002574056B|nr:autotransporter domain-containing protein [Polynucleobacter sp. HIN9]
MAPSKFSALSEKLFFVSFQIGISFFCLFSNAAHSAPCTSVTGGENATISVDCEQLVLDSAGVVTINSGATVSGNQAILNSTNSSTTSLNINGTISSSNNQSSIYIQSGSTINSITNSGSIASGGSFGGSAVGIYLEYQPRTTTIANFVNSGTISVGNGAIAIGNAGGVISLLSNTGTISAGRSNPTLPYAIDNSNDGLITTLNNSGTISTGAGGVGINNSATITSLDNSGSASAGDNGSAIRNTGTISTLNNSGTISVTDNGTGAAYSVNYGILNTGSITTLSNQGNITVTASGLGSSAVGIRAAFGGTVTSFLNSGAIRATTTNTDGVAYGIRIWDGGTFSTITNTGSITAVSSGVNGLAYGIASVNVLTTLNNAQGGNASSPATTALTYRGVLPTNYNIIINSASYYGQLAVSSPIGTITNFGIYGAPFITLRTYGSVLSGTALPSGTRSGTYDNMTWSLVENGSAIDLVFTGASLMGTQQSLVNTASVLQGTFTLQNSVMVNGFTYDCSLFDRRGICVSAGGRNTTVQAQGINNTSGLLIASYRLNKNNSRIGAWVDQNLSVNGPGTVKLGNSTPMIGLFGVWSQRPDGVGAEVKVSAAYGQKDTTITRQIVGLSEAGSGSSKLISQGAQVVAKYGFAVLPDVVVSPYAGVRYTQNNMGGYTEATSSAVTTPLTYSALNTNATTALAGAEARYRGIPKTTLFASAGVETDTNTSNGSYSATGITGLTPVNFNPNPVKTRPTATVGGYYDILKNQRIGITGIYRQEPFQAVSTTTVLATYTIGL